MTLIKLIKIWWLRRKAKSHYEAYFDLFERYDCGRDMIEQLTGGKLGHHRNMFNIQMDQLYLLDKSTPTWRMK